LSKQRCGKNLQTTGERDERGERNGSFDVVFKKYLHITKLNITVIGGGGLGV
jgi:hypothetical protein